MKERGEYCYNVFKETQNFRRVFHEIPQFRSKICILLFSSTTLAVSLAFTFHSFF